MGFPNEGGWDRVVRVLIGLVLLVAGWQLWSGALMVGALAIATVVLLTGLLGWCPAYALFGWSTYHRKA